MMRRQKQQSTEPRNDTTNDTTTRNERRYHYDVNRKAQVQNTLILSVLLGTLATILVLIYHTTSLSSVENSFQESECELYLAPSLIPNSGRGVFAGKNFDTMTTIDKANSVSAPMENLYYEQVE